MNIDATGPKTADRGVLYIYDAFSFTPQSLQGADILAHSSSKPCLVIMVDWFKGDAVKEEWMVSGKPEDRQLMQKFIETTANPNNALTAVTQVLSQFKSLYPAVTSWGGMGFCWGGKIISLLAAKGAADSPLVAAVQSSPARLDPEEAKTVTIPMAVLASAGEDAAAVKQYGENLKGVKHVETFGSQVHGWMSARADLDNAHVRKEYERGYKIAVDFFDKYV
ncbi:hypothetical protein F4778DRAFT_716861 [Xylariomycetidae sp. FL2044]|nr:hypothetical protein F4778DRAFT_716861 [Xylariomycetidae sp. FL2044]